MDLSLIQEIESRLISLIGPIEGSDSNDKEYDSIQEFWKEEHSKRVTLFESEKKLKADIHWYENAYSYWESEEKCPVSDDGVLAGFGFLTPMDCKGSNQFLDSLMKIRPELNLIKACDCGAGIGRVTKNFLLKRFENVDMVDSSHRLLENAPAYIGADATRVNFIQIGLQDYVPEKVYDVIWIQWVVGHLMDEDYINFFKRCLQGIREGGVIILKDNCAESSTFQVDRVDSSVSRHVEYHKILFDLAGLQVLKVSRQKDFPEELCPVVMFALIAK